MIDASSVTFPQEAVPPAASRRGVVVLSVALNLVGLLVLGLLLLGGLRT